MNKPVSMVKWLLLALVFGLIAPAAGGADEKGIVMTVVVTEPHNPKLKETSFELKTGKKKGVRKHCRLEVDAAQGYFVCENPAFSMTLLENNTLLVGKKLYRIKSIRKG